MLLLQGWRGEGGAGVHVRTWYVKSNCFYISSCWLLIYSTVYLHLCWGMCELLACVSVCVCVQQLPKSGGRQLAVSRAVGECSNLSQRGIVCEIQMLEMAPLFAYCYHCSLAQKRRVLGFDLTREKQNDKLSRQLSSNPPLPSSLHFLYTDAPPCCRWHEKNNILQSNTQTATQWAEAIAVPTLLSHQLPH